MMSLPAPFTPDLKVLVLAGSSRPDHPRRVSPRPRRREVPLDGKAFLTLRGRLVVEYVLDWLHEAGLQHIWVLGPEPDLELIPGHHDFVPLPQEPGASPARNIRKALETVEVADDEPALTVFGDHPLTTRRALLDFLEGCAPFLAQADYFHALALEEAYAEYAPHFRRTSMWMGGAAGRATGLNLVYPHRVHRLHAFDHVYSVRKLDRVGRFLSMLVREIYLLGRYAPGALYSSLMLYTAKDMEKLSRRSGFWRRIGVRGLELLRDHVPVERIERYAARVIGAERGVKVVPLAHGGTAIDVDFAEELAILEEHWEELTAVARAQDAASEARRRRGGIRIVEPAAVPQELAGTPPGTSRASR